MFGNEDKGIEIFRLNKSHTTIKKLNNRDRVVSYMIQ